MVLPSGVHIHCLLQMKPTTHPTQTVYLGLHLLQPPYRAIMACLLQPLLPAHRPTLSDTWPDAVLSLTGMLCGADRSAQRDSAIGQAGIDGVCWGDILLDMVQLVLELVKS